MTTQNKNSSTFNEWMLLNQFYLMKYASIKARIDGGPNYLSLLGAIPSSSFSSTFDVRGMHFMENMIKDHEVGSRFNARVNVLGFSMLDQKMNIAEIRAEVLIPTDRLRSVASTNAQKRTCLDTEASDIKYYLLMSDYHYTGRHGNAYILSETDIEIALNEYED